VFVLVVALDSYVAERGNRPEPSIAVRTDYCSLLWLFKFVNGESRTQQEAFSGRLVATSTGFSGSSCLKVVQCCLAL